MDRVRTEVLHQHRARPDRPNRIRESLAIWATIWEAPCHATKPE